jgi:hypothetical protein
MRVNQTFDWIRVQIVLESESVLDIHHYSLLYIVGQVNFLLVFEEIILLRESVCVASCSLEAFWFCYSVLKSPEKNQKNTAKKRGKKSKKIA